MYCWWECKLVQPLRRTVYRFLKKERKEGRKGGRKEGREEGRKGKKKKELPYNTTISLLGIYLKKMK